MTSSPAQPAGDTIVQLPAAWPGMLRALPGEAPEPGAPEVKLFKIRFADNIGRRRSASVLVQRRYASRGYSTGDAVPAQPTRITFSAFDGDAVIATISVGVDSPDGLFVDGLFGNEIAPLRGRGARLCEFTRLAIHEAIKSRTLIASLFHIAYVHAHVIAACTDLLVEVNPRHVNFYRRMLAFTVVGTSRMDPRVNAAATLLHLDLSLARKLIAKHGGNPQLAASTKSLYPLFFSPTAEQEIAARLRSFG